MKIRVGFISNSSSSSFLVFSKENSLYEALEKEYDNWMGDGTSEIGKNFLANLKYELIEELSNYEGNHFYFDEYDQTGVLTTVNEFRKWYDEEPSDKIKKYFANGMKVYYLDIPDYGEGGTHLQKVCRHAFKDFQSENLIILNLGD
jgi:hypothetical protein